MKPTILIIDDDPVQRRLLEEVGPEAEETGKATYAPSRKTAIALLLLLPGLAVVAYGILGNPKALDLAQTAAAPKMTANRNDLLKNSTSRLRSRW